MAFKSLPVIHLMITFTWGTISYLPKSSVGLHINAKTEIHEQSPRGTKVPFKAKHRPKSQQVYMVAKTTNFSVEWTGPRGNQGQELLSMQQFSPKPVQIMLDVFIFYWICFWIEWNCVFQLFATKCYSDPNIWVMQKTRQGHISATLPCALYASTHASGCYYRIN